jgi:mRNA interferase MazF
MTDPRRAEVWLVDFGNPIGHEASRIRPAMAVSDDAANATGLVSVCPVTRTRRGYPTHVELEPGTTGLDVISYVQTEQIRTVSTHRLVHRLGTADVVAMRAVEHRLRLLLRL